MEENSEGQQSAFDRITEVFNKPRQPNENDLFSRMPEEVFADVDRKLAEALPVYAVGHPHPMARKLAGQLFEQLMIVKY